MAQRNSLNRNKATKKELCIRQKEKHNDNNLNSPLEKINSFQILHCPMSFKVSAEKFFKRIM